MAVVDKIESCPLMMVNHYKILLTMIIILLKTKMNWGILSKLANGNSTHWMAASQRSNKPSMIQGESTWHLTDRSTKWVRHLWFIMKKASMFFRIKVIRRKLKWKFKTKFLIRESKLFQLMQKRCKRSISRWSILQMINQLLIKKVSIWIKRKWRKMKCIENLKIWHVKLGQDQIEINVNP